MRQTFTEHQIIDLFRDAAQSHSSVNEFRWAPQDRELIGLAMDNLESFPGVILQSLGGEIGDAITAYNFNLYCLDNPVRDVQINVDNWEWDSNIVDSQDTTLQIIKDIIGDVKFGDNQQHYNLTQTSNIVPADQGDAGWRVELRIEMQNQLAR